MNFSPGGRGRRIRLLAAGLLTAAVAAIPTSAASASPAASAPQPVVHQASTVDPHLTSTQLGISMQVQQYDEWCWVASGATIAAYKGVSVAQNTFCDLARGYSTSTACPNQPGYMSWDQNAFSQLGINPGYESGGALGWSTVVNEINYNRPVLTGIYWTAGGGHAEVIYGYDSASQSIYFGDPWPSDNRYNLMSYSAYVSNSSFTWGDAVYGIGG